MGKLQTTLPEPKQIIIKNDVNDEWNGKYIEGDVQYKDKNSISYLKDDNHHLYFYDSVWQLGNNGVKVYKQLGNEISREIDLSCLHEPNKIKKYAVMWASTINIGDDIQTLAGINFLKKKGITEYT